MITGKIHGLICRNRNIDSKGTDPMKVITLLNEKGGVGKTTMATHIAAGLAILGYRVVLVDSDPQANATTSVGLNKSPSFYDLCVRNAAWRDVLEPVHPDVFSPPDMQAKGGLFAVASNEESRNVANSMRGRAVIRKRFSELSTYVDFLIVDTSPTPSLLNEAILVSSDYVLLPTDCEAYGALEGTPNSLKHIHEASEGLKQGGYAGVRLLGIVPTKYRKNTIGHNEILRHLQDEYKGLVWDPIRMSVVFSDAQLMGQFLYGFAPKDPVTKQIWQVTRRVEKVVMQHEQT